MLRVTLNTKSKPIVVALTFFFLNRIFVFEYISLVPLIDEIFVTISEAITIFEIIKFFLKSQKTTNIRYTMFFLIMVLYFIYFFIDTLIQGANVRRVFMAAYPVLGTVAFLLNEGDHNLNNLIRGLALFFKVTIVLTFIDALFVRQFLTQDVKQYLIGGRNQLAITLTIAAVCVLSDYHIKNNDVYGIKNALVKNKQLLNMIKSPSFFFMGLIFLLGFFCGSSTVLVCLMVMIALYSMYIINIQIDAIVFGFVYVVGWISLVVLRLHELFGGLISDVFHKDVTLSHRTIIWDVALGLISKKPFLGYGSPNSFNVFTVYHDYSGNNNGGKTTLSGHNQIIQILYYGGIVMLAIVVLIYILSTKNVKKSRISYCFFISVIVISFTWLTEAPGEYAMFFVLTVCYITGKKYTAIIKKRRQRRICIM